MNQEIKQKLEQAAIKSADRDQVTYYPARASYFDGFTAAAQTILDNPVDWGLTYPHSQKLAEEVLSMQSQLTKYREALERIVNTSSVDAIAFPLQIVSEFYNIAKEALKQEDTK